MCHCARRFYNSGYDPQQCHVQEQSCITPAPNKQRVCHVNFCVLYNGRRLRSNVSRYVVAGTHQSLVVVTAAPPTPGPPLYPSDAEEVGRMCQQLPQCVGSCDLHQEASSSGRQHHEHVASEAPAMQVMCIKHVYHTYTCMTYIMLGT